MPETVYLAADRETVLSRLRSRGGGHSDDFELSGALAAQCYDQSEPPTPDEGP